MGLPSGAVLGKAKRGGMMKTGKFKYTPELAGRMYLFFVNYNDTQSAPSFEKFARSIGTTRACLEGLKKHKKFSLSWEECEEILRDYLIDMALTKKFDPTFVKYMLTKDSEGGSDGELHVKVVVEE